MISTCDVDATFRDLDVTWELRGLTYTIRWGIWCSLQILKTRSRKTQNSRRKLLQHNLKITSDAHDMGFARYLRVTCIAVRTTRNYQNHSIGHLKCNAELAPPWNSRRVAENALSLYDGLLSERYSFAPSSGVKCTSNARHRHHWSIPHEFSSHCWSRGFVGTKPYILREGL